MAQTGLTAAKPPQTGPGRKRKNHAGRILLVLAVLSVLCVLGYKIYYTGMFSGGRSQGQFDTLKNEMPNVHKDKVTYFLVAGLDNSKSLTDIIMVLMWDDVKQEAKILQIPRDTYVGRESASGKINAVYGTAKRVDYCPYCHVQVKDSENQDGKHTVCGAKITREKAEGIVELIRVLRTHLGIPVDHYVTFTTEGFRNVVDAVGGVEMTIEKNMSDLDGSIKAGAQVLDGKKAEWFVRHRATYAMGDLGRVKAQRTFYVAFAQKLMDMGMGKLATTVLPKVYHDFATDMAIADMVEYSEMVKNIKIDGDMMYMLPGEPVDADQSYYSVLKDEAVAMLNETFIPYGDKLEAGKLQIQPLQPKKAASSKTPAASSRKSVSSKAAGSSKNAGPSKAASSSAKSKLH